MATKTGGSQRDPRAENMMARQLVLQRSVNRWTQIFQRPFTTGNILGNVVNVPLRNVGLVKRYYVRVDMTFARGAAETQTLTSFGPANTLSQIILTDLANNNRIQTSGWHLFTMSTVRKRLLTGVSPVFGGAFTNDSPVDFGNNFNVISAPASVSSNATQTLRVWYEVPVAYSDYDLRGAIFANVVNATFNLQLTINPQFSVASTADGTLAVYKSSTADLIVPSLCTVTVYANYLDQLPMGQNGPILPLLDLGTAYLLNNTFQTGFTQGQDYPITYANFRDFLSTTVILDQNGTLNPGTDVNYFALQSANYTRIWEADPILATLWARNILMDDPPAGVYYFDSRERPINTDQYGNMELVINPSTATGNTVAYIGYEQMAIINQVTQAGSLAAGG